MSLANMDAQGRRRSEAFDVIARDERCVLENCYASLTVRSIEDGGELRFVNAHVLVSRPS